MVWLSVPMPDVVIRVAVGQEVVQLTVWVATQLTPFALSVNTTDCPGVNPETVKFDGDIWVPVIGEPPSIV